jgi:ring-1,2-phenylacetyl-CoA epoxidase subunit PaaD
MSTTSTSEKDLLQLLAQVMDPELPVLSIVDLGILRKVNFVNGEPEIIITPTYSGCPAMDVISLEIKMLLLQNGIHKFKLTTTLSPAWTTDWMSETAKEKLCAYGIAPPTPGQSVCETDLFQREEAIACPQCGSYNTSIISQFGSTACKALYRCNDCQEPFDYFKCH